MDDVRDARHRLAEAFRVADRARAHFDVGQMGCDEPPVAGGPEQEGGGQTRARGGYRGCGCRQTRSLL